MSARAEKVGRGPCPNCTEVVTFRRSAGGLLKYSCDVCDSDGYAQPGGKAHRKWMASITPSTDGSAPAAPPAPAAPAPAKPPARRAAFDLSQLGA